MKILAATNNRHKLQELRQLLGPQGISVLGGDDVGGIPEMEENGDSFRANAILKAQGVSRAVNRLAFADDSGLEVQALNGEPGIHTARYGGDGLTDAQRVEHLLRNLAGVTDRRARFVCVLAVAAPAGLVGTACGEVRGRIAEAPSGRGGFGYDPVFIPENYNESFAVLDPGVKQKMSHRARAVQAALALCLFRQAAAWQPQK